ncbi:YafY family protein [Bacillus sp. Cr_A10]|uniref:helix-turn-helix transcriptional regulator n=1 Tax=Bacillus sp. Cr_A10 TaxID=3033993 RepID=UPI0023DA8454|nr:YafY family protein [Bacillus sp. Cr_A10]MDF2065624.1 YafY family protein [Bacillus sp. Cr_A10]
MKTERLFSILVLLLNTDKISAEELAKKFEVSKRTIYRDLESLSMSGLPIISIHGRNGGVGLMPSYKMDKHLFTDVEKQKLIDALNIHQNMLQEDNQILIEKLENLQGIADAFENFSYYSPTLHRKEIEEEIKDKIKAIRKAITYKKKLKIKYTSMSGENTNRIVSPSNLQLKDGSWFMEAYCDKRQDKRLFKLTRIREYKELEEECIKTIESETISTKCYEEVELIFSKNQLGKLYDFFLEDEIKVNHNDITVTFTYDNNQNLLPFLLMFSSSVDVVKPEALKISYYRELNKINKKINDDNQLSYIP